VSGRLVDYCVTEREGTRRQDLPPAFLRNGAIYVARRQVIMGESVWGTAEYPYEMPPERSVNIDEPLDFLLAEAVLQADLVQTDLLPHAKGASHASLR
jgi:CMP-N,N'-diacetyllegionaminic acid synthase